MNCMVVAAAAAGLLVCAACSSQKAESSGRPSKMGELVRVGPLTYSVIDTEWLDQLGEGATARLPQQRFLAIGLSVSNSGSRTSVVPGLALVDAKGEAHNELVDAQGLRDWLGYLRMVQPNETQHGRVLFDVPAGAYRLRLSNDADPDQQITALVDIPFQLPAQAPPPPTDSGR